VSRALEFSPKLVVAADGGAIKAEQLGLTPHVVVGDGDSLPAARADELRGAGVEVLMHPVAKDESDTELAVREALSRGATSITVLGAFGGARLEHSIANLLLLTLPELAGVDACLVDGPSTVRVIGLTGRARLEVRGVPQDFVSLLPLSDAVAGITTGGLRFPLTEATLSQGPARGLSNELIAAHGSVTTRSGRLAVVHTVRTEAESNA
jgi:thiamine pyrophosphokinase